MNQPTTPRGNFAVILATASVTLALGITTAALTGTLAPRRAEPEATVAPTSDADVAPAPIPPPEVMPIETQLAWVEPVDDRGEREHREHRDHDDDDDERDDDEREDDDDD